MDIADVALVGAGPIGLEMAVGLRRAGISYLHFDAKQIGYTISWFAPQTRFFSSNERIAIAGVPLQTADQLKSTREEYLRYLRTVVELYDLKVRTYEPVTAIEKQPDAFMLTTRPAGGEKTCRARKIIFATGGTDHPRRLGVPGEDLPHVHKFFQDPHTYFRKKLLIVGGRNSAVEAALRCHHAGAEVSLSYRRQEFDVQSIKYWLTPEILGLINKGRIKGHLGSRVCEIRPDIVIVENLTGRSQSIPADFVLPLIGYESDMRLLRSAGIELQNECQIPAYDPRTMETNVSGIYVAGTAVGGTQDKYRLFIENCHAHVDRILAAITGQAVAEIDSPVYDRPET